MYTSEKDIESFLTEYRRSKIIIETTARAALNRAIEFEHKFSKPFYQFTIEEALEMYESAHAVSVVSLQNTNLLLKNASRWFCYKKNDVLDSAYEKITKDLLETVIDTEKQSKPIKPHGQSHHRSLIFGIWIALVEGTFILCNISSRYERLSSVF